MALREEEWVGRLRSGSSSSTVVGRRKRSFEKGRPRSTLVRRHRPTTLPD